MDPDTKHQIEELLPFMLHPSPQVASLSLVNILPYTVQGSPYRNLILNSKAAPDGQGWLKVLAGLSRAGQDETITKIALTALVNLTDSIMMCAQIANLEGYVDWLLKEITDTTSPVADEACMLLSNLTRVEKVCAACLKIESTGVKSLRTLVDLFAKEGLNPKANYDYLAHVFANVSALNIAEGRESLLGMPESLQEGSTSSSIPLADLVVFTEHSNVIRRASVASTLKNCAFVQPAHQLLLSSGSINFLPYILLPLCGPEEFSMEESENMPEECQLLPPDKKREPDPATRLMLIETLMLLCGTRSGRDILRGKGVYEVVKVAHRAERDEDVRILIERLVNLLMRDEAEETKIEELATDDTVKASEEEDDDDLAVQEV